MSADVTSRHREKPTARYDGAPACQLETLTSTPIARISKANLPRPRRDVPVDQGHDRPGNSASPLLHIERCAAAYREQYGGIKYGGLPVKYSVFIR